MARSRRSSSTSADGSLVCPRCGLEHSAEERFCSSCEMPLVPVDQDGRTDELTRHARKISPRLARGEPQRVTVVRNLAEGEMLQGILLEEGIPSILRRTGGFDVPDMLAAGPRDLMVPASAVDAARDLLSLGEAPATDPADEEPLSRTAFKILAVMLVVLLVVGLVTGTIFSLTR